MSTKDEAERLAEEFVANFNEVPVEVVHEFGSDIQLYRAGFLAGEKSARVQMLVRALENWIAFEEDQIKQHGPYTSLKIPERMDEARRALEYFNASPEEKK